MTAFAKKLIAGLLDRRLRPWAQSAERHEAMLRTLAEGNFQTRALVKRTRQEPIHLVLVAHMPALWSTFDSLYAAAANDPAFRVTVVAVPYRHASLPAGQYKDEGIFEFLTARHVKVVRGYNQETGAWLQPEWLAPDYVFFQTPYDLFPAEWSVSNVSMLARIGYVPYGASLFKGEVVDVSHPPEFFSFVSLVLMESQHARDLMIEQFRFESWFDDKAFVISGFPKLDYITARKNLEGGTWRRRLDSNVKRILWTPRWRTSEHNCHFFDYKDFFVEYCRKHTDVDFVFRPHPLCLQNFVQTGEMTAADASRLEQTYRDSANMTLDRSGDYQDTFLTSDVLVTDISSMMLEFFATGKPVIYTHRVDNFNRLGERLAEGFYWVRNASELDATLTMLFSGKDPLKSKRQDLLKSLFLLPEGGAGAHIKEILKTDFAGETLFATNSGSAVELPVV